MAAAGKAIKVGGEAEVLAVAEAEGVTEDPAISEGETAEEEEEVAAAVAEEEEKVEEADGRPGDPPTGAVTMPVVVDVVESEVEAAEGVWAATTVRYWNCETP